jgi:uncharacterized protein (UPF0333 family)
MNTKGQVSIEYLIIVGFVTVVLIGILGVAFIYSGAIKDQIKMSQVNNYANKIISASESVYYSGSPSKTTLMLYLPEGVKLINITNNSLYLSVETSTGLNEMSFSSNVPINGNLIADSGIRKIQVMADTDKVVIGPA